MTCSRPYGSEWEREGSGLGRSGSKVLALSSEILNTREKGGKERKQKSFRARERPGPE